MSASPFTLPQLLTLARAEAQALRSAVLGTPHLFIALTKLSGLTAQLLEAQGHNPKQVRDALRRALGIGSAPAAATPKLTARASAILKKAESLAETEKADVAERHLLTAILDENEGITLQVLKEIGVDLTAFKHAIGSSSGTPTLDQLGRDLTQLAREGKINPLIGRKDELRRLVRALARKSKNNPVLIGPAGVGKTAIVEGLAQFIAAGSLAELAGTRLVEITTAALVADTTYRGQFEKRLLNMLDEIKRAGNVILFIDELHTILRAGAVEGGALDAGNILKPALARGDIRLIGATTTEEYKRFIASDAALERRFQPIIVNEPTLAEAIEILQGVQANYASHHNVQITSEAIEAAVRLSARWLPDRRLPDKAFDLLDEACTRARLPTIHMPDQALPFAFVTAKTVALVLADWLGKPVDLIDGG